MSGEGSPRVSVNASGLKVALISGMWHDEVIGGLVTGAREALAEAQAEVHEFQVGGAFELPLAAQVALTDGEFDIAVCLGVIVRGGTPHFEYIASSVTDGLTRVQLDTRKPVGFGVLTTDTIEQALDRAGLAHSSESKGVEAVEAALSSYQALVAMRR